jgi:hypothetical protein
MSKVLTEMWELNSAYRVKYFFKFNIPPFFSFFVVLGFELRAFTLSHSTSPISVKDFFEIGSCKLFLSRLALNCNPPDLCLLSS